MRYKRGLLVVCLIVCLFSIAGVCASDVDNTAVQAADDSSQIQNNNVLQLSNDENDLLGEGEGSFRELQDLINKNSVVNLTKDYADGSSTLSISKDMVINGNGHSIRGNDNTRILTISGGNVVLNNLTFEKGKAEENGGAIYVSNAVSLTVNYVKFNDNYANDKGGAICINCPAPAYFSYCDFNSNLADNSGGAIYTLGSLNLSNSNFNSNAADDDDGGAIFCEGYANISNCSFKNNKAEDDSAIIYLKQDSKLFNTYFYIICSSAIYSYGNVEMTKCKFESNRQYCGKDSCPNLIQIEKDIKAIDCYWNDFYDPLYDLLLMDVKGKAELINIHCSNLEGICLIRASKGITCINTTINGGENADKVYRHSYHTFETEGGVTLINSTFIDLISGYQPFMGDPSEKGSLVKASGDVVILNCFLYECKNGGGPDSKGGTIYSEGNVYINWGYPSYSTTLMYGNVKGDGGGIYAKGNVYANNALFLSDTVDMYNTGSGGAIYAEGDVYLNCSSFEDCHADKYGGAVYCEGDVHVYHSRFLRSDAKKEDGGAIYARGNVDVVDSTFSDNHACIDGGAIFSRDDVSVKNCIFENNYIYCEYPIASQQCGGAIRAKDDVRIEGCTFRNNHAPDYGGAIYADTVTWVGTSYSYFIGNYVEDNRGGAIYANKFTTDVVHGIFINNSAKGKDDGGAIYIDDWIDIKFSYCVFEGNTAGDEGGAIYLDGKYAHLTLGPNNSFINNHATTSGQDVYNCGYYDSIQNNWWGTSTPDFTKDRLVEWHSAGSDEYYSDSNPLREAPLLENVYSNLVSIIGPGGDMKLQDIDIYRYDHGDTIKITKSGTIDGNGAIVDMAGSKISVFNITADNVTIKNFVIRNVDCDEMGGAIYVGNCSVCVVNCSFINNAVDNYGGAIYVGDGSVCVVNCSFINNAADTYGGAIYVCNGSVVVENSSFAGNGAEFCGAAIYVGDGSVCVVNCSFIKNAADTCGGAIYVEGGCVDVSRCIFVNNSATYGGAIYSCTDFKVVSSLFLNNTAEYGNEIYFWKAANSNVSYNSFLSQKNGFFSSTSPVNLNDNWWGVNNPDWNNLIPERFDVPSSYVVLNVTAVPENISTVSTSKLRYAFYLNGTADVAPIITTPIQLSSTAGRLKDKSGYLVDGEFSTEFRSTFAGVHVITANADYQELDIEINVDGHTFSNLKKEIGDGGNITLKYSAYGYDYGSTIDITKSGTIDGNGATINMVGSDIQVFNITAPNVIIKNLIIKYVNTTESGGAISFNGVDGAVVNCTFINNTVNGFGAAINFDNDGIVINCSFINNTATSGGAVNFNKQGNVSDCSFVHSSAEGYGGAIYFGDDGAVNNCSFIDNNAANRGGAVNFNKQGNVSDCSFVNNFAIDGGAVLFNKFGLAAHSSFADNRASNRGGALCFFDDKGLAINCSFVDNRASKGGSATAFNRGGTADSNWWGANNPDFKSLIVGIDYPLNYAILNVTANPQDIEAYSTSQLNYKFYLSGTDDVADIPSRAISLSSSGGKLKDESGYLVNGEFSTEFTSADTGDFEITSKVDRQEVKVNVTVKAGTFSKLIDEIGEGGNVTLKYRVYTYDFGDTINITKSGCIDGNGAVIEMAGSDIQVFNIATSGVVIKNLIIRNANFTGNGGAVYFKESGSIENCTFINNTGVYGGAIYFKDSGSIDRCIFMNNTASNGSAIYFEDDSSASSISNSTFLNNTADSKQITVTEKDDKIIIVFKGGNNLLNAIYSNQAITFTNVTYWGVNGISNTGDAPVVPVRSENEAGQIVITFLWVDGDEGYYYTIDQTDKDGSIVLDYPAVIHGNYTIIAYHEGDSYYSEIYNYTSNSSMIYVAMIIDAPAVIEGHNATVSVRLLPADAIGNVTIVDVDGSNITVNVTAGMARLVLPVLPVGNYTYDVVYSGNLDFYKATSKVNITVNPKIVPVIDADDLTTVYNSGKSLNATIVDGGVPIEGLSVAVKINGMELYNLTTNTYGRISVPLTGLAASANPYTVDLAVDSEYYRGNKTVRVTIDRAFPDFNVGDLSLFIDESDTINITDVISDTPPAFTYESANESVAVVFDGFVRGVSEGDTIVTVTLAESENYTSLSKDVQVHVGKRIPSIYAAAEVNGTQVTIEVDIMDYVGLISLDLFDSLVYLPINYSVNFTQDLTPGIYSVNITALGNDLFVSNWKMLDFIVPEPEKLNTSISAQPSVNGNSVTITVDVDSNATGYVEISIAGNKYCVPVDAGKAVFTNEYSAGVYSADVTYLGDDKYNPANATVQFSVIEQNETLENTSIEINVITGENYAMFTVDVNESATGLVEINIAGEAVYLAVNNGQVTYEVMIPGGTYTVTATYLGDDRFNGNTTSAEFTVKDHIKVNTTIATSVNVVNSTVTLTVNVNENATGFVEISVAGKKYYVSVDGGKAVFADDYLPGTYVAEITYLGDDNFNNASDSTSFTVIEHNVTKKDTPINIDVVCDENNVTITVNVDSDATGLVEISIDGEAVYLPVNNGKVIVEFLMDAGNHKVTATYLGDAKFNSNVTSTEFTVKGHEKVNTTIKSLATVDGNTVTLTVTINNGATGFVEVGVAGKKYYVPVDNGNAVLVNDYLAGTYVAEIAYMGDDNFNPAKTSTSFTVIEHNVTKKDTPIGINVVCVENNVTITVKVDANATGLVEISSDGEALYLPVNNGEVIGEFLMDAGDYKVTATYLGDGKFNGNSTSAEFTVKGHEKVNTTIKSQAIVDGNTVTLAVTVNANATGFVEISIAGKKYYVPVDNGNAVLVNDYLAGTYVADIAYLGDDNFNPARTSASFTVIEHNETKKDTPINIGVVCVENNVTITVNVDSNATGLIELNIDGEAAYLPVNNGEVMGEFLMDAGNHKVTATYLGDGKFNANTTSTEFTVKDHEKINTTIKSQATVDGNTVTLTVTINNAATGFVEVNVAGKKYYLPVEKGKAQLVNDYLAGTYVANIAYLGDDNFNPAKTSASFTVIEHNETKKDTPINIGVVCVENNVTITVNIDPNATGLIEISSDNEAVYLPVNNGMVIGEFLLDNGDYNVTATYLGDNKFNGNSTSTEFTVKGHEKVNTTIKSRAVVDGNTVTLTVTVNANATGFAEVNVAGKKYYVTVEKGNAVLVNDYLAGTYVADINYLGDDNFNPAKDSVSFTVIEHNETKMDTPIDIGVDVVGNYVNITVSVDANATGLVEISIDGEAVYLPVNNGVVIGEFIFDNGDYNVTATYLGDYKFNGNTSFTEFTVEEHMKVNTTISASVISIENTAIITVKVNENATGFVELYIGSTTAYVKVEDGVARYNDVLPEGTYSFTVNYLGDDNFNENTTSGTFTVSGHLKRHSNIDASVSVDGDDVSIDISVPGATGYVTLDWGENTIYVPLENGSATFEDEFESGSYDVNIVYFGDDYYLPSDKTVNFTIGKVSTKLTAGDITMVYNGGKYLVATLKDADGNAVRGVKVTIKLGDVTKTLTTDGNGQVSLSLDGILPDVYTATITFDGDDVYDKSSATAKVTITKLQSKVYLRNALYFTLETKMVKVVLWDADNKPLAGKTVHITLNEYGLTYSGVTDENGVATIRIGVGFGVHSATVSFDGDEIYDVSNRTGSVRVIKETPSIMVRGANTHFKASTDPKIVKVYLWDRNSKPLPVNSKVAIKINGQTFIGYTDSQGIASIKINVNKPGIFNAQVTYAGNSAYNAVSRSVKFVIS